MYLEYSLYKKHVVKRQQISNEKLSFFFIRHDAIVNLAAAI